MAVEVAGEVVTSPEETIAIKAETALTAAVGITGVETAATVRSSRPAATIRTIKGMILRMVDPWSHTMEDSQRTNRSMLCKDVEDRPEEALVKVRTDEEDKEDELERMGGREETGISPGQQWTY